VTAQSPSARDWQPQPPGHSPASRRRSPQIGVAEGGRRVNVGEGVASVSVSGAESSTGGREWAGDTHGVEFAGVTSDTDGQTGVGA
jgi:hypothetical protein